MSSVEHHVISSVGEPREVRLLRTSSASARVRALLFTAMGLLLVPMELLAQELVNRNVDWTGETLSGVECYGDGMGYGPYDYVTEKEHIEIVEKHHFMPNIERLVSDRSGRQAGIFSSIDYTLRAVPNHHRALWSMAQYYLRRLKNEDPRLMVKAERLRQGGTPPECYFQRAKAFKPSDGMVSAVYGVYLHKRKMFDAALVEYSLAEQRMPQHSEVAYNMGLLYLDLNNLERAEEYAKRAAELGYPLQGLQRRINQRKQADSRG